MIRSRKTIETLAFGVSVLSAPYHSVLRARKGKSKEVK